MLLEFISTLQPLLSYDNPRQRIFVEDAGTNGAWLVCKLAVVVSKNFAISQKFQRNVGDLVVHVHQVFQQLFSNAEIKAKWVQWGVKT